MRYNAERIENIAKMEDSALEKKLAAFLENYGDSFQSLMHALDEAHVSHYSNGCGMQRVTYDIFPASAHVREFMTLLTFSRPHRLRLHGGYKDASTKGEYNPASEFVNHMVRWHNYAEQVMRHEGDSERGIAAARAKLIIDDLLERFGHAQDRIVDSKQPRASVGYKQTEFTKLLREVGLALEAGKKQAEALETSQKAEITDNNYFKALSMAKMGIVKKNP